MTKSWKNYYQETKDRLKDDPVALAEWRAKCRAQYKKYVDKLKSDPVRYAKFIENRKKNSERYFEKVKSDPKRLADYRQKAKKWADTWKNKMKQTGRWQTHMRKLLDKEKQRYHSDPEYRKKKNSATVEYIRNRRQQWLAQGLNFEGKPYKPKKAKVKREPVLSQWEKLTGKTLQDWADQQGMTRERVRQVLVKAREILDDCEHIFAEMKSTGEWPNFKAKFKAVKKQPKVYTRYGTKYSRDTGMTQLELAKKYDTYKTNIMNWRKQAPDLTFEQWDSQRYKGDYPGRKRWK